MKPPPRSPAGSARARDMAFMAEALAEARRADEADEVPVGCVIVHGGRIVARGRNRIREFKDPTAHAEVLAIRAAGKRLKSERLRDTILYSTMEPCPMCAGAIVLARVPRVVYAAADPKAGAAGSVMDIIRHARLNHRSEVAGGIRAAASRRLVRRFFQIRRRRA